MRKTMPAAWLLWSTLMTVAGTQQANADQHSGAQDQFFKDVVETRGFTLGRPMSVQPTPDGKAVLFLESQARDPVLRLYELTVRNGKVRELVTPEGILEGRQENLTPEERARRERQRMTLRGFTFYKLSLDGSRVLVSLSGKLFVVERGSGHVEPIFDDQSGWIDPQFSPGGEFVSAVKDNDIYLYDLDARQTRQVTRGATDTLTHGVAEFVAQEEMGRYSGYWWSPDGSHFAYQETDLTPVQLLYIASPFHPEAAPLEFRYPRAGTDNARVRLGIVPRDGGDTTWVIWDATRFPYLARVVWQKDAPLTLLVQSRDQQTQRLLSADIETGETTVLLEEHDDAWLNLPESDLELPFWLPEGQAFVWATERRAAWQLELYARSGELLYELTPPELGLGNLVHLDLKRGFLVASGGPDPREAHLFKIRVDGSGGDQLTTESGLHEAVFSSQSGVWVHTSVLEDGTHRAVVRNVKGRERATLPSQAEEPPFLPNIEFVRIGVARQFDAVVIRPRDFEPTRAYPVIVYVYGGPGHKVVVRDPYDFMRQQWMADRGYVVVSMDGRGTPGHGRAWERVLRGNLVDTVLEDQIAGLTALGKRFPEMDMNRVGITGWSFGGYATAMAVLRYPEVFKVGVSGAPVTDWRDYDTHYTERYMGLPDENPEGYRASSALTYAGGLERPLLLIHGLTDDNVYFIHTLKLADALFRAGRRYDLIPLPGTHLLPDPEDKMRLWAWMMEYFDEHLGVAKGG